MEYMITHMRQLMDTILEVRFTDLEREWACCQELLTLAQEQGSTYAKAFACTYLGDYYLAQSDAVLSGEYLLQARQICFPQTYPDLYMKLCHLSGFYYHIVYDEQNALHYYLEALALAQTIGDIEQTCNTWNNIADMFQRHGHMEEAKRYYLLAHNALQEYRCTDTRLRLMVQYNLAELCGLMGNHEEVGHYLALCEALAPKADEDQTFYQLCCLSGRCLQAVSAGDRARATALANEIMAKKFYEYGDKYTVAEFTIPIGEALVALGEAECAKLYIDLLGNFCTINETQFMQRLVDLQVSYAEAFCDGEVLTNTYRNYCHTMRKIQSIEDDVRTNGMKAKIHLQEVMRQQENTLLENKRLEDAANVDELTGIYNRRFFNQKMEEAKRGAIGEPVGIVMMDIDYFKQYNDTYGHIRGDMVLQRVAAALRDCADERILPCRYGGDEFSCLCINLTDEEMERYIERVRTRMHNLALPHYASLCSQQVTLTVGYSNGKAGGHMNAGTVLAQADQALYEAKAGGRNRWCRYGSVE